MKNWKTSVSGAASIFSGIALILKGDVPNGATSIIVGIGLLFAKDYNVSGTK